MGLIGTLADHLVALDMGRVIAHGLPKDVLSDAAVVDAYLGEPPPPTRRKRKPKKPSSTRR
jgi:ABC-type uncharacterized transport system ATPase subunit